MKPFALGYVPIQRTVDGSTDEFIVVQTGGGKDLDELLKIAYERNLGERPAVTWLVRRAAYSAPLDIYGDAAPPKGDTNEAAIFGETPKRIDLEADRVVDDLNHAATMVDIDVVHIWKADENRCVVSLNGQGHLPCEEHTEEPDRQRPGQD